MHRTWDVCRSQARASPTALREALARLCAQAEAAVLAEKAPHMA